VAEQLCLAFGVGYKTAMSYAALTLQQDASSVVPEEARHFFPLQLVRPGRRRNFEERVDFAVRLWLFERHCALAALERLLLFRLQLAALPGGIEAAAANHYVLLTNHLLVSACVFLPATADAFAFCLQR